MYGSSVCIGWNRRCLQHSVRQSRRIDGKVKINPLNFLEVVHAFPQYQVSDYVSRTYGVIGGVAGYINHWDQRVDLKANICRNILNRNGYMQRASSS